MRFKSKEKAKLDSRRKLWSLFDWFWAYKKGDNYGTEYTSDENKSNGYGYLRKHHSLNCGCIMCQARTLEKRMIKKTKRMKDKKEVRELMKVINCQGEID